LDLGEAALRHVGGGGEAALGGEVAARDGQGPGRYGPAMDAKTDELRAAHDVLAEFYVVRVEQPVAASEMDRSTVCSAVPWDGRQSDRAVA
jgi:hypothetical protein